MTAAVTGRKGSFSNATFQAPATTVPGEHLVIGQDTSDPARTATFAVIAVNWPKFHHDLLLTGFDPGKALIGPGNVSSLSTGWAQATGNSVESSSAVVNGHVYAGSGDRKVYVLEPAAGGSTARAAIISVSPGGGTGIAVSSIPSSCRPRASPA